MKNLLTLLIIPILFLVSCKSDDDHCPIQDLAASDISNQEEYLIIGALLSEYYNNSNLYHISQKSLSDADTAGITRYINNDQFQFDSTFIEEYVALNSSSFIWGALFTMQQDLINHDEIGCYFSNNAGGWSSYYAKYEDSEGYLRFGRPALNDNDEAIVVYSHSCGWLCGYGYVATLKKENGTWIIQQNILTWIS